MTDIFRLLASDFRVRAEDIFARAERVRDADIREKMRGIAVGYEKMAQRVEQHARDVDEVYARSYAARCRCRAANLFLDGWERGVTFDVLCSCARPPLDPTREPRSPVPPQLGPGFRSSLLRAAACAYSKALPFGDLPRGVIGVSPSRPEVASAVGRGGNCYTHRRDPRSPSSPPSNSRRRARRTHRKPKRPSSKALSTDPP